MSQNLSSAAVAIGALWVKMTILSSKGQERPIFDNGLINRLDIEECPIPPEVIIFHKD